MSIHDKMRDPNEGRPVIGDAVIGARPVRPTCGTCSADFRKRTGLPAAAIVERALILRADTGGYLAVVHCHGASDVIDLGPNPDELTVGAAVAFKKGK